MTLICSRCRYKLLVIRELLKRYDYLMYMDSDAFFLLQVPLLTEAACCRMLICTARHAHSPAPLQAGLPRLGIQGSM